MTNPEVIQRAINFKFRSNDIIIASYPKSDYILAFGQITLLWNKTPESIGTTWTSEVASRLAHLKDSSVDLNSSLADRVPYLEILNPKSGKPYCDELNIIPETHIRLIKTHFPPSMCNSSIREAKPKVQSWYF